MSRASASLAGVGVLKLPVMGTRIEADGTGARAC